MIRFFLKRDGFADLRSCLMALCLIFALRMLRCIFHEQGIRGLTNAISGSYQFM